MSIFEQITRIVVNDGKARKAGDRVQIVQTSRLPPEFQLRDDPDGRYTFLEASPLQIRGLKLMRVHLMPAVGAVRV